MPNTLVRIALLTLIASIPAHPQITAPNTPPTSVEEALHQLSDHAAIVFLGEVTAVRLPSPQHPATVEIDFRVDIPIRGLTTSTYTLREWPGLWPTPNDAPRYRPGIRLLILLHAPNALGLSSPVGGLMAGAIPIRPTTDSSTQIADLRWLATHLFTPITYASTTQTTASTIDAASFPTQQAPVATILSMLTQWPAPKP